MMIASQKTELVKMLSAETPLLRSRTFFDRIAAGADRRSGQFHGRIDEGAFLRHFHGEDRQFRAAENEEVGTSFLQAVQEFPEERNAFGERPGGLDDVISSLMR